MVDRDSMVNAEAGMTPGQVKRRSGHRLATTDVLLVAAVAVVGGVCGASGECTGVVWRLLAGLRSLASAGQDGSLCLFVLQLGLCIGFVPSGHRF